MSARKLVLDHFLSFPVSRSGDRAPRLKIKVEVYVQKPGKAHEELWHSVNFSRTGLLIEKRGASADAFPLGTELKLRIIPDKNYLRETIQVDASVKRIFDVDGVIRLGLRFEEPKNA